jgi:NitT/TauT family transport system substrate-binding protein
MRSRFRPSSAAVLLAGALLLAACGGSDTTAASGSGGGGGNGEASTVRLGYFPNFTHAPALVGVEEGLFEEHLGDVSLTTHAFNAGPEAIQALFGGEIDMTFIGPNPAINGYAQSDGAALRIVAGAASGGASLVVREDIETPDELAGTTLATPQLGNTQDVALRNWLREEGFETSLEGAGDVSIAPTGNGETLAAFGSGAVDGAWLPEPWATRLVTQGGAHVLVDEADLWPDGRFVTTHLIVSTEFLTRNPDVVRSVIEAEIEAVDFINDHPEAAQEAVNAAIATATGERVDEDLLAAAWPKVEFTVDPIASSLFISAAHAEAVELLDPVDLDGIYDLEILNDVLTRDGRDTVAER